MKKFEEQDTRSIKSKAFLKSINSAKIMRLASIDNFHLSKIFEVQFHNYA